LGLYATGGDFSATPDDSAMVFEANGSGTGDDAWFVGGVAGKYDPSAGGVPSCQWSGVSVAPDLVIAIDTPLVAIAGVEVGAPYRQFRKVHYGLYLEADGRWWLGRKVGAAASWEKLTGPLSAPSDSGLAFRYYDQSGSATTDPTLVRMVDIVLRGESYGKVPQAGSRSAGERARSPSGTFLRKRVHCPGCRACSDAPVLDVPRGPQTGQSFRRKSVPAIPQAIDSPPARARGLRRFGHVDLLVSAPIRRTSVR
jgi:hypothetical protein